MLRARCTLLALVLLASACGGGSDATTDPVTTASDTAADTTNASSDDSSAQDSAEGEPEPTEAPAPTATPMPEPTPTPEPAPIDETNLQEALLDAQPGDVIEIPAGTYSFERGLSLAVDGVTIRGAGMDETVLSFANQVSGAEGLLVTASDFTIEDIAIEDSVGDALKINEGNNIVIRRVRTEWTGGWSTDNGAYGIYPVQTTNVLIEDSVAIGASDAGIYVGQSADIVVRNNRAEFNVAGIEIENSERADVYGNVAANNTGGILVFNLPGLERQGFHTRVYDNDIYENNTENFGHEGTAVAEVPAGTGVLIMANDRVEVFDNRIRDNRSSNVIVTSAITVGFGGDGSDADFDGFPEGIYIHDNELSGGGDNPDGILRVLGLLLNSGAEPLPSIVWDGFVDEAKLVDGEIVDVNRICVQQPGAEVLNADGGNDFQAPAIDSGPHDCTLEPLAPVDLALAE